MDYAAFHSVTDPGHFAKRDQRGLAPVDFRNYGIMGLMEYLHMNGVLPWYGFLGSSCRYERFCPGLAALVDPVQIFCSSLHTFSLHLSLSPSKLGRQSCHVACLLIYVSGFAA
jgi:hypothetical protein